MTFWPAEFWVMPQEVEVSADVPPLGLWGPAVHLEVAGHAVREAAP
jgi:hypothetical protein